jgi:O-antigen/teichoic acid export membrane protein
MTNSPPESSGPPSSLSRLATRSVLWTGFSQYFLFGLGLVKTVVLARLIGPDLVGLLAGASVWASYFAFARTELRLAVYSSKEEPHILTTQFILENASALLGIALAGLVLSIGPGLITPSATWPLIFILLFAGLFETLTSTPIYLIDRRLRQDVMARLTIFSTLIGFIIPVLLAWLGWGLAALLVDLLLPVLIQRLGAAIFIRWRPAFIWDRAEIKNQLRLAWTMFTTGILGKIIFQFDDWLVYNFNRANPIAWLGAGVEPEGLYSRAYNVGKMPMDVAAGMIGSVALSLYSESAARGREVLVSVYRQLTWLLTWIIFFSSAVAFAAADEVIYVLGPQWVPMVPLFRLMILFVVGRPLFQNNSQLLLALRAENDFQKSSFFQAIWLIVVCPPLVYFYGAAGASVAVSLMSVLGFLTTERYVSQRLGTSIWPIYIVPALACLSVIISCAVLTPNLPANLWMSAIVKGLIGAVTFGIAVLVFERHTALTAWQTFRAGLKRPE